jgi:hypothetical protein
MDRFPYIKSDIPESEIWTRFRTAQNDLDQLLGRKNGTTTKRTSVKEASRAVHARTDKQAAKAIEKRFRKGRVY